MKYIGKHGEYSVLSELLRRDAEAYLAIKSNQENYDVTVILDGNRVVRVQVKSTGLNNKSTNNSISNVDKNYDFLVLVVVGEAQRFFILAKSEVLAEKANSKGLYTTQQVKRVPQVKPSIAIHENRWDKIIGP